MRSSAEQCRIVRVSGIGGIVTESPTPLEDS
jgi:hypothetical protein